MKLKKILSILLSAILVLSSMATAFAYTGDVTVTTITSLLNYNGTADTGATMDETTMIHTAGTTSNNGYIRTGISHGLKGDTYACLSFEVLPSAETSTEIVLYEEKLSDGVTPHKRATVSLGKVFPANEKTRVDIVFSPYDKENHDQSANIYINGLFSKELYNVSSDTDNTITSDGTKLSVVNWGLILIQATTQPSDATGGQYTYTYSDVIATQYPADATFAEVIAEVGSSAFSDADGVIWSGVPTVSAGTCTMDSSDAVNGNFNFTNRGSGSNRPGANIKTGDSYTVDDYSTERYVVTEAYVTLAKETAATYVMVQEPINYTDISINVKEVKTKLVHIADTKEKKYYLYLDNVPSSKNGTEYTTYSGTIRIVVSDNTAAAETGDFFKLESVRTTVYADGAYDPLKPVSGSMTTDSVGNYNLTETNEAGVYSFSVPATTDKASFVQTAIWTTGGAYNYDKDEDYPVDLTYMHTSMEIIPTKFDGGDLTVGFTHNGSGFNSNTRKIHLKNIGETYKFDFFWDYATKEVIAYINGTKLVEGTAHTRIFGTMFEISGLGTEHTESPVELTVKNVQTTKYYDNNPVYASFDALVSDKVTEKAVSYNYVTAATYSDTDGAYTFSKEIFGYNSDNHLGIAAAYDAQNKLLGYTKLSGYSGDEVITTNEEAAKIKILIWGIDNLNPLTAVKEVTIAQ